MVVEFMRQGKSPEQACLDACKRIVDHNKMARLKDDDGRPNFSVSFYAVNTKGEVGSACILSGGSYAVADENGGKVMPCPYLYKRPG
jgi:N4-(beta-N-acetylglucosaminyl)-L-asparaginase